MYYARDSHVSIFNTNVFRRYEYFDYSECYLRYLPADTIAYAHLAIREYDEEQYADSEKVIREYLSDRHIID